MIERIAAIEYDDQKLDRDSCFIIFKFQGIQDQIGLSISIRTNGDIDTHYSINKAKEIAEALYKAIEEPIAVDSISHEIAKIESNYEKFNVKSFAKICKARNNCVELSLKYKEPEGSTDIETLMTVETAKELADAIYQAIEELSA